MIDLKKLQSKIEFVKISLIKSNPDNPRTIKDADFFKLVDSIRNFPKMLLIRPIVVNEDMMILGGSQRMKAAQEAGMREVPIIRASMLTPVEQKEFIIKDNISSGDWDRELLDMQWDQTQLQKWGMEEFAVKKTTEPIEQKELTAFRKTHVLISFPPEKIHLVQQMLEKIKSTPGIEYEQSSN